MVGPARRLDGGSDGDRPAGGGHGNDDVRLWFAERRPADRWNIWYRSSIDGGVSWSAPVLISDATPVRSTRTPTGSLEFNGDYGEVAVMSNGKTIATWTEGFSWLGPGGTWFNVGA